MALSRRLVQIEIPQPAQVERWQLLARCLNGAHVSPIPAGVGS